MSTTTNPVLVAAAPALINVLQAIQAFATNIGPDPAQWVLKLPGAFNVLLGDVEMQLPVLAAGEAGALQAVVNTRIGALITQLKAVK